MGKILTETKKEGPDPKADFAKKEKVIVPADIMSEMRVTIPPVFYWEDVVNGESVLMTMAFIYKGMKFGMSYPIEEQNAVRVDMMRKRLFGVVKESLDVLCHHGTQVLDAFGNIDPKKVNEQEATRYRYDPYWQKKVAAFNQLVRIAPITREKAEKLGLLDRPKVV